MSAHRMILRRQWREDEPAHFNRASKARAAAMLGGKLRPRLPFQLWCLKTLRPAIYAKLMAKALDKIDPTKVSTVGGEVVVTDEKLLETLPADIDAIVARELAAAQTGTP